ncbi:inner ear-specific collagen-like [Latimeria chalumnae]|uniref:inner ear-specific collagen-like n=1 Tax=Latimeria chalumnae TaxID=7897 RepID=UPI0006D8F790|nr:PREDICTED: inner ear-specific collagen-like [Latimeria chalumnae]|eukprot:XP_005995571.2 PREDICTED: inner ear-specific collagen-like [Latimeria chalumnae]
MTPWVVMCLGILSILDIVKCTSISPPTLPDSETYPPPSNFSFPSPEILIPHQPGNFTQRDPNVPASRSMIPDMTYDPNHSVMCQSLIESGAPVDTLPWYCMCMNCKGEKGDTGEQGPQGLRGPRGPPGRRGIKGNRGFLGRRGPMGAHGFKGQKGAEGEKGDGGVKGDRGFQGLIGLKGEKGHPGINGIPGKDGEKGDPGICSGTCVGNSNFPATKGDKGHAGPKGDKGHKGDQGEQPTCNCTKGEKGLKGETGSPGTQGLRGDIGPKGEQGVKGDKGFKGDEGETGPAGPCTPTLTSAFTVALRTSNPVPNLPLPFNRIISNDGGGFSPMTGTYTAPVNGTYVFSYNLAVGNKFVRVGLFKNFRPVIKTTDNDETDRISQLVILHLVAGDRLWLQVKDEDSNGIIVDADSHSTFSGFLLYPDTCDQPISRSVSPPIGDYSWDDNTVPTNETSTDQPDHDKTAVTAAWS